MILQVWRLSETTGDDNLGLACTEQGLVLGRSALNANDQGLARIAAVHLRIPDLPDQAARDAMEVEDVLIE